MKEFLQTHKRYLLTGVSHVIPLIACGGILIAGAQGYAAHFHLVDAQGAPDMARAPGLVRDIFEIGRAAFRLFPVALAGFIAHGMAGKPGLAPGLIGGYVAGMPQAINGKPADAGFLGALIIGLVAGHAVNALKKLRVPRLLRPIMPVLVVPVVAGAGVGLLMMLLNIPLATVMQKFSHWLGTMQGAPQILLALALGAIIAFDMGGPVNKAAFFLGAAMIPSGNYAIMGACAAAICTPPLGLALATLLNRNAWPDELRQSGLSALGLGMVGITEGAIAFAAADPRRVIPGIMLGSMLASVLAMLGGVGGHAPHGGLIVLPFIDNWPAYIIAIAAGSLVTALTITLLKKTTERHPA